MPTSSVFCFDPGAVRTGIAVRDTDGSIYCMSSTPWMAVTFIEAQPPETVGLVILEQWVAYPHAAAGNAWRDLLEVRTIGAIERHCMNNRIPYEFQPTKILKPTTAVADSRGYFWKSTNRDEKAAETHLYYHLNLKPREDS